MKNKKPKELMDCKELRDKWAKVYTETLEKYPNIKIWLDFKSTTFVNQLSDYTFPERVKYLEEYIDEVIRTAESINTQIDENIEKFKEFTKDLSPRFVIISAMPGLGMPEREYPKLYYAIDFKIEEFDSHHKEVLRFYGTDGLHNGFISVFMFPNCQVIRNMTREEFDKFLSQKLSSTNLTPWDFDEYKNKWIKLYEDTTDSQFSSFRQKTNKL